MLAWLLGAVSLALTSVAVSSAVPRVLDITATRLAAAAGPTVHAESFFEVKIERGIPYALGVLCEPKPCAPGDPVRPTAAPCRLWAS
jgi:hypothetical protein